MRIFADAPNVISEQDQATTPETPCPTLCDKCVGSLTSPADHNREDAGDRTYGLSSLSEKTSGDVKPSNSYQVYQNECSRFFCFCFKACGFQILCRRSGTKEADLKVTAYALWF